MEEEPNIYENDNRSANSDGAETAREDNLNIIENMDASENINTNESNEALPVSQTHEFDLNLPTSHSYLGSNLEELRGRTILDDGIYMNLPLLIKQSLVLFPGQTLPMAEFGTNVIDMFAKCIQKDRTFGVVCLQKDKLEVIGTTAEIYEYRQGSPYEGFCIKAKGRQRFQILRMIQDNSKISANVKILPEITLTPPFFEQRLSSLDYQRITSDKEKEQTKKNKIERFEATMTTWPSWVYRQYDPYRLAFQIHQHLQFIETRGSCIPTEPTDLSFWVAQNLPLNDNERIMLLKYNCAISRLQWELKYLSKDRILVCNNCEKRIGKQSDIFPMSIEGPQSKFCNAAGYVHDTVTLYQTDNLHLSELPPSSHFSWFPGYAWTTAACKGCYRHMGWYFTAETNKSLKPSAFWGLTRSGLKSKKISKNARQLSYSSDDQSQSDFEENYRNSSAAN